MAEPIIIHDPEIKLVYGGEVHESQDLCGCSQRFEPHRRGHHKDNIGKCNIVGCKCENFTNKFADEYRSLKHD